jgi:hypothetical protein
MSRIAIIDTAIDREYIGGKAVEHINLCGESSNYICDEIGHGTLCAMVLDCCASDYELVNIQIFKENRGKVFGEVGLLEKALGLCRELEIDIVSLSAVSSVLSDSKRLYDITRALCERSVVVSALDNKRYVTVPTCYPFVLGVRNDTAGLMLPGEMAYSAADPFGANVYANCNFTSLNEIQRAPSNSLAVPVVAAYVNGLLNRGNAVSDIAAIIQKLKPYPAAAEFEDVHYRILPPAVRVVPVVFIADASTKLCIALMDSLYDKYEVQSSALSFVKGPYDVRIKTVENVDAIAHYLSFMERHYKTDLIFVTGKAYTRDETLGSLSIDVELKRQSDGSVLISYEGAREFAPNSKLADRLYGILT